jgi:DNA polymerase
MSGNGLWAAWNAAFDKAIWNFSTQAFPDLKATHIIDVMAQAMAAGLPSDLAGAARASRSARKDTKGRKLIELFCLPRSTATPQSHPAEWGQFVEYATQDTETLRSVFLGTRQLPLAEWREYWAMEAINERGVAIDLPMVTHAATLADQDKERSKAELRATTQYPKITVDAVAQITGWLLERLPAEGRAILTKRVEEHDEDGTLIRPAKYHLTRRQVEKLIAYVKELEKGHSGAGASNTAELTPVLRVLQIRLYGGSKTPAKFTKMVNGHVDGVLFGQYVFNGAAQTGRASSKGVQVHNLARDTLPNEHEAIEALLGVQTYDQFCTLSDSPAARMLSLLIRPAFVPACPENVFVWSDWSQIEARIVPWLADYQDGARARLQIFRDVDENPSLPDLYTRTAAALSHCTIEQVTKAMRQRGKVAELALGFCGGVGALQSMAAAYGMHLSDTEAREIVDRWRAENPWVQAFSRDLWETMRLAHDVHNRPFRCGRVHFMYLPDVLGGTMQCILPSGRALTYRALRWEMLDVEDDDGNVIDRKLELTFARGHGRMKLWPGMFVENITQAVAADVLRGTLVRLESQQLAIRLHTHDEILAETPEAKADEVAQRMRTFMRHGFPWSKGLPLMSEETIAPYYTKHEG